MSSSHSGSPMWLLYAARSLATRYLTCWSYSTNFVRAAGSVTQHHKVFLWTQGSVCHSQKRSSEAPFDIRKSNLALIKLAGTGSSERTISWMASGTTPHAVSVRSGVASASRYRCSRSA